MVFTAITRPCVNRKRAHKTRWDQSSEVLDYPSTRAARRQPEPCNWIEGGHCNAIVETRADHKIPQDMLGTWNLSGNPQGKQAGVCPQLNCQNTRCELFVGTPLTKLSCWFMLISYKKHRGFILPGLGDIFAALKIHDGPVNQYWLTSTIMYYSLSRKRFPFSSKMFQVFLSACLQTWAFLGMLLCIVEFCMWAAGYVLQFLRSEVQDRSS